jgi:hypothetical protein
VTLELSAKLTPHRITMWFEALHSNGEQVAQSEEGSYKKHLQGVSIDMGGRLLESIQSSPANYRDYPARRRQFMKRMRTLEQRGTAAS